MAKAEVLKGKEIELPQGLVLYVVRNSDGQFFRAKGYNGYGQSWVDDINKAKFYGKTSGARGTITYFVNNFPKFPAPDLIMLTLGKAIVIDEKDRIEKAKARKATEKERRELSQAKWNLDNALRKKEQAEEDLKKAKAFLDKRKTEIHK